MRPIVLTAFLLLGYVTSASAQTASRFEIGPVVRLDHVFVEGDMTGRSTVAGVVGTFKLSKTFGVEGEITQASNQLQQSREGWFVSYVTTPNPTREEIERMAPTVLIARGLEPGIGWSAAFVARGDVVPRVSLAARVGLSARDYVESETYTILRFPDGVDPQRVANDYQNRSFNRARGGLLLGLDSSVVLTKHLSVTPELRIVYGGSAQIGNKYREVGLGARGTWRF
jgi:hypothetical protein